MKTTLLFVLLLISINVSFAEDGLTCESALEIIPDTICSYQNFTTSDPEMWFHFTAQSNAVNISLISPQCASDLPHIHQVSLIGGSCFPFILLAQERLWEKQVSGVIEINLNGGELISGSTYYIRIDRIPSEDSCDKENCNYNNYSNHAEFQLCIQNLNVVMLPHFELESPIVDHEFMANVGQFRDYTNNDRPEVKFYCPYSNPSIYLCDTATSLVFNKYDEETGQLENSEEISFRLLEARTPYHTFKAEEAPDVFDFFNSSIADSLKNIKSYYMLESYEVYEGIDLVYYSNEAGLKMYFVVHPGANPGGVHMKFSSENVDVRDGGLQVKSEFGTLFFEKGHAWQISNDGQLVPLFWNASFTKLDGGEFKFNIGIYDGSIPLIIQIDQGHRGGNQTMSLNPFDYECQDDESDEFNDPNLDLTFKWDDPCSNQWQTDKFPQMPTYSKTVHHAHGAEDYDPNNSYSHNSNLEHGVNTLIVMPGQPNATVNTLKLNTKWEPLTRHTPGWDVNTPLFTYAYTTAAIESRAEYKYGYFEIRAKLPGNGVSIKPAFWLTSDNPFIYSEIDVFEMNPCYPLDHEKDMCCSIHFGPDDDIYLWNNVCSARENFCGSVDGCGVPAICTSTTYQISSRPDQNWHVYGVDWQPSKINIYVDGNLVKTMNSLEINQCKLADALLHHHPTSQSLSHIQSSIAPQHIVLNASVNGSDNSTYPYPGNSNFFDIDYVKVCKVKPDIGGPSSICLNETYDFYAHQYYYTDNTIDTYTWNVSGGTVNYMDPPTNSHVRITITDPTLLTITVTASEPSWRPLYFIPIRYSSSSKSWPVNVLPVQPLAIVTVVSGTNPWGPNYRAQVTKSPDVDEYYWSNDNGVSWHLGVSSGNINYYSLPLIPPRVYNIRVKAKNCMGYSAQTSETIDTKNITGGNGYSGPVYRLGHHVINSFSNSSSNNFIYPNPSNNSFTFKTDNNLEDNSILSVQDISGRVVEEIILNGKEKTTIFGRDLNPGIYLVSVNNDNNHKIKIVKTNK